MQATITSLTRDIKKTAIIWTFFCLLTLGAFILTQKSSYMEIDALSMWVLSCAAIIYLSQKGTGHQVSSPNYFILILGFFMCLLSFFCIPLGITNPPYTIGEFSLLLSGLGVIVFALLGFHTLLIPVSIPFIAVMGFSVYEVFLRNEDWITAPLIPIITGITVAILNFLGLSPTVSNGNLISFMSQTGNPIYLSVVSDCTGIWSLGTFTVTVIIVLSSFPDSFSKKSLLLIAIGYLGAIIANLTRIVLIALAGYFFGPSGVIENVHIHIGWIAFSVWLIIFWYYYFTRRIGIVFFKKKESAGEFNNHR
jgi:exosortase/archaeosortase family protein